MLFLAPACILSVLMTGSVRAESPYVFSYISEEGLRIAKARMEALEQWKQSSERAHAAAAARQRHQQQQAAAAAARARQPVREESPAPSSTASSPSVTDQPVFASNEEEKTNQS